MSETMAASNGYIHSAYEDGNGGINEEDKRMLLTKKNGNDGHGITALINRQLQGNWWTKSNTIYHFLLLETNDNNCFRIP